MRLDKFLSSTLKITRSDAKKLIRSGRVVINPEIKATAGLIIDNHSVIVDGTLLASNPDKSIYIAFNKPTGVVCSHEESNHPRIYDLLPPEFRTLQVAGRLDVDTTGLVLLTNDGAWNHKITHPTSKRAKRYLVTTKHPISDEAIHTLRNGVMLHDSDKPTRPAQVSRLGEQQIELTLSEGRYHQVKRMIAAVSNRVVALHRAAIGSLCLDLEQSQWRHLTSEEVEDLSHG